jgi:Carboxypeptidase regulatory-like domain
MLFFCSLCFFIFTSCNNQPQQHMETAKSIKAILKDSSGKPVANAVIMIIDAPQEFNDIASVSNERGEFSLLDSKPGKYTIQINHDNILVNKEVVIKPNDTTVIIKL